MNYKNDQDARIREQYAQVISRHNPKSPILLDCVKAFLVGGLICVIGQGVSQLGSDVLNLSKENTAAFTAMVMVFLGALLTGVGIYDKIGAFGGAGSAVPITGFANSVVAPAMEFRQEGVVMGTGARIFSLAGPVLVHGLIVSIIIALIHLAIG